MFELFPMINVSGAGVNVLVDSAVWGLDFFTADTLNITQLALSGL
jgi:hypothetical protein